MPGQYYKHPSSFRDPAGFIFEKDGILYRQVNLVYKESYDAFIRSGCYELLVKKRLLIPHQEMESNISGADEHYKTLKPQRISHVSYPWEWSFSMLKDAALLTLQLVKESIRFGIILKDATPYNVQWHKGEFIFIDTLSFEPYDEKEPWVAYRQFCESFLSPLLLMHYSKMHLPQLQLAWPRGIPLQVTSSLLPRKSRFSLHTYLHIHLHAKVAAKKGTSSRPVNFSKQKLLNLLGSLETLIKKLKPPVKATTWSAYYEEAAQRDDYLVQKKELIRQWGQKLVNVEHAVDLGANDGEVSRLLSIQNINVLATDADPLCIDNLYNYIRKNREQNLQPLILDVSNPSPAMGVNNEEHASFLSRTNTDLVMALALIHHLVIGQHMSFDQVATMLSKTGQWLIIEFVPKEDPKVQEMLAGRKDVFIQYTKANFEATFGRYFSVIEKKTVGSSGRVLYLMSKND